MRNFFHFTNPISQFGTHIRACRRARVGGGVGFVPSGYSATFKIGQHDQQPIQIERVEEEEEEMHMDSASSSSSDSSASDADTDMQPIEECFHPVLCVGCETELGVYDSEEVYHFYNVVPSTG